MNTGKFVGRKSLEDTILRTNMEAADEVVRQLRLRDIGGIIIIDFIDMAEPVHRDQVFARLNNALERDRTKTRVSEISRLGLVEMTRKNVTDGFWTVLTQTCPTCTGQGRTLSDPTVRIMVTRRLREILRIGRSSAYLFAVAPSHARGAHRSEPEPRRAAAVGVRQARDAHGRPGPRRPPRSRWSWRAIGADERPLPRSRALATLAGRRPIATPGAVAIVDPV